MPQKKVTHLRQGCHTRHTNLPRHFVRPLSLSLSLSSPFSDTLWHIGRKVDNSIGHSGSVARRLLCAWLICWLPTSFPFAFAFAFHIPHTHLLACLSVCVCVCVWPIIINFPAALTCCLSQRRRRIAVRFVTTHRKRKSTAMARRAAKLTAELTDRLINWPTDQLTQQQQQQQQ